MPRIERPESASGIDQFVDDSVDLTRIPDVEWTMRYSELNTLAKCATQYRIEYVLGLKPPGSKPSMIRGSAVHALLQGWYQSFAEDDQAGRERDPDRAWIRAYRQLNIYEEAELGGYLPEAIRAKVDWAFTGYRERFGTDTDWYRILWVEHHRTVPLVDVVIDEVLYRVILRTTADLVVQSRRTGRIYLVDHKLQPNSERVATPEGWSTIGELCVGSRVIGRDGLATRVSGVFPQGSQPIYEIRTTDGGTTRAGGNHLWRVGYAGMAHAQTITTEQLKANVDGIGTNKSLIHLPHLTGPVEYVKRDLPVDPYTLGILLGDGTICRDTPKLTEHENDVEEVLSYLDLCGDTFGSAHHKADGKGVSVSFIGGNLKKALIEAGVWGYKRQFKFVPPMYLTASVEQRYELLRGLMDSDGNSSRRNSRFINTSPALARAVRELVWSLGGRSRMTKFRPYGPYRDRPGTQDAYCVYVTVPECPHKLERKVTAWKSQSRQRYTARRVVSVELVGEEDSTCIEVEATDALYVTADYLVTHNTAEGRDVSKDAFSKENQLDPQRGLYTASFKRRGPIIGRLPIWSALHNAVRCDQLKRKMTIEERFGRHPVFFGDIELDVIWADAQELAREAVRQRLGIGIKYPSPDPLGCKWCSMASAHVMARQTGRPLEQLVRDFGFKTEAEHGQGETFVDPVDGGF